MYNVSNITFYKYFVGLTEDSWGGLMTESFNGGGKYITGDENSLLFELLLFLLKHQLSKGVFCKELDNCWQYKDSWD